MELIQSIQILAFLVLVGAIANVAARRVRTGVRIYAAQSLVLGVLVGLMGYQLNEPHVYVAAALVVVVKGFAMPGIFLYIIKKIRVKRELESFLGIPSSLMIAAGLVGLGFYVSQTAFGLGVGDYAHLPATLLGVSLATMLIGFFLMLNRKKAISAVIGLSVMENGLFLAAMALTSGMPLIIEAGVFFEFLAGAVLMGILILKINERFDGINTHDMHTLVD
jgi:hydrogenase-4 component E